MSEETIKMLNIINDKVLKCKQDNNCNDNTLFVIPLGCYGDFGYLTDKMLDEILQLCNGAEVSNMSLDKAIKYGKEKRKPYYGCKAVDPHCRNHGNCPWCRDGRLHKHKKNKLRHTDE